jgi:hypothetical protein
MKKSVHPRIIYAAVFLTLLITEVIIALFVRDAFIRPYGGDILVTVLLCAFVRIVFPKGIKLLPLFVFAFSVLVELAQYINIVEILGLSHIAFFRIVIGTSFSWIDIICYGAGCIIFFVFEFFICKMIGKK